MQTGSDMHSKASAAIRLRTKQADRSRLVRRPTGVIDPTEVHPTTAHLRFELELHIFCHRSDFKTRSTGVTFFMEV
jgi:hypothetical protein